MLASGRFPEARLYFAKLYETAPDYEDALGNRFHADQHCADWSHYEANVQRLLDVERLRRSTVIFG